MKRDTKTLSTYLLLNSTVIFNLVHQRRERKIRSRKNYPSRRSILQSINQSKSTRNLSITTFQLLRTLENLLYQVIIDCADYILYCWYLGALDLGIVLEHWKTLHNCQSTRTKRNFPFFPNACYPLIHNSYPSPEGYHSTRGFPQPFCSKTVNTQLNVLSRDHGRSIKKHRVYPCSSR